ncbi:hypothetical protein N2152v2_003938 [Parachlorella kessleri]
MAAEVLAMAWKAVEPHSYVTWRELLACVMLVASMAIEGAWQPIMLGFSSVEAWGSSDLSNNLLFPVLMLWGGGCLSILLITFGRPVSLWLQLPVQAVVLFLTWRRAPDMCSTALMQHEAAEGIIGGWFEGFNLLLALLPLPCVAPVTESSVLSKCQSVAMMFQLLASFVMTTAGLAVMEYGALHQFAASWAAARGAADPRQAGHWAKLATPAGLERGQHTVLVAVEELGKWGRLRQGVGLLFLMANAWQAVRP